MQKFILISGCLLACFAVAIGAFAAHGLKDFLLETQRLDTFETAVKYHIYHSFALLFVGLLQFQFPKNKKLSQAGILFFIGTLIFSGSLYTLCLTGITWLGAITPFGGVGFILGWSFCALAIWKEKF
jgi:uncharacterized membrane protein YgdD (TMEM256/DUF423 family)